MRDRDKMDQIVSTGVKTFHQCVICNAMFIQEEDLEQHSKIHVKEEEFGGCQNLNVHSGPGCVVDVKADSGDGPIFACNLCDAVFDFYSDLEKHCDTHIEVKASVENKLTECGDSMNNLVKKVKRIPSWNETFECNLCFRSFRYITHLQKHKKTHDRKPYKCQVCRKSFKYWSELYSHNIKYPGENHYKCEICGKSVQDNYTLKLHIRIHTGEKPYKCEICDKSFSGVGGLGKHMKVHSNHMPFKCDICGKSYKHNRNLKKHKSTHT